jgi:2,3,4,5-tetrahydropyridine-2-carboxylate N-succinyltransferase
MSISALENTLNAAFDARDTVNANTKGEVRDAVELALDLLDKGEARVAERQADGKWQVNQWLKKAVLLSFRLNDMAPITGGPGGAQWWDKVPSKFEDWGETVSATPASAPCRARSSAARPSSPRTSC